MSKTWSAWTLCGNRLGVGRARRHAPLSIDDVDWRPPGEKIGNLPNRARATRTLRAMIVVSDTAAVTTLLKASEADLVEKLFGSLFQAVVEAALRRVGFERSRDTGRSGDQETPP